jgi:hypothetical protein
MAFHDRSVDVTSSYPESLATRFRSWASDFFAGPQAGAAGTPAQYADDMATFELIRTSVLKDRSILIVEARGGGLMPSVLGVVRRDLEVRRLVSFEEAAHLVWRKTEAKFVIIVDIDCFDSMSVAVDTLRLFRMDHPGTIVIIASAYFARHDFSGERRPIADTSLRLPTSRVGISLAISCAIDNNLSTAQAA